MRISDWSSDVCSSDLVAQPEPAAAQAREAGAVGLEHRLEHGVFVEVDHARLLQLQFAPPPLAAVERGPERDSVAVERDGGPEQGPTDHPWDGPGVAGGAANNQNRGSQFTGAEAALGSGGG